MFIKEVLKFIEYLKFNNISFDENTPFSFILDNDFLITLESSIGSDKFLIITLSYKLDYFNKHLLKKALSLSSLDNLSDIDYTVGYSLDTLLLITSLNSNCTFYDIENAILKLKVIISRLKEDI